MIKSTAAVELAIAEWAKLRTARPTELDNLAGFEELNYEFFEEIFSAWHSRLDKLSKSKWMGTAEATLADIATSNGLNELRSFMTQAHSHGLNWLLSSTGFLQKLAELSQRISTIADRRTGIAKSLAKELAKSSIEEAGAIAKASAAATTINTQAASATRSVQAIEEATTKARDHIQTAESETSKLTALRTDIEAAHSFATDKRAQVAALHDEVVGFRTQAESKSSELEKKIAELTQKVNDAESVASDATTELSKALVKVRKQGLAGAFSSRGTKLLVERIIWILVFVGSLMILAYTAHTVVTQIESLTLEALSFALLRRLALAAPMVWLGWFAAKQLGRLGRVQEDYEYKAATALAFESYLREVEAFGDTALTGELLKTTITNFGANPVRLYDRGSEEPASPTADLISRLESDGSLKLLAVLQKFIPK